MTSKPSPPRPPRSPRQKQTQQQHQQQQQQQQLQLHQLQTRGHDWANQEWLLGEVSFMLGTEEMLQRACNVCRAWRSWCNTDVTVLDVCKDFRRLYPIRDGVRYCTGVSIPLFLPLVPRSLRELTLSGDWTAPTSQELATIRWGCRLRKLVMTGVRLFSFSYRELLLFEHLQELNISDSFLDVPLPRLRYAEPAGNPHPATKTPSTSSRPVAARTSRMPRHTYPRSARAPPCGRVATPLSEAEDGVAGAFDSPKFAGSLKRLTATKTKLWARWDLSAFPVLTALEVSYAGRTLLQQLHRKLDGGWRWSRETPPLIDGVRRLFVSRNTVATQAEMGSRLAELSVCDLALRNLVDAFGMPKLVEAVGGVSTFRLRRVDVVKEVASFAYLRAILSRLHNLQVLELTDVGLDDSMLSALGGCLSSTTARPCSNFATGGAGAEGKTVGSTGLASILTLEGWATADSGKSIVSLRTLILGNCGGVSEMALEKFLALVGGGREDRAGTKAGVGRGENGGGVGVGARDAVGSGVGTPATALSTVRLEGCKSLGDRGLAALCEGTQGRLVDIQVTGTCLLTDSGVESLAKACPRLTHVDISGCICLTSNALSFLLVKCPALLAVKAWGVRVAGNPGGVARAPSAASTARALREAYERRNVELLWAGPLQGSFVREGCGKRREDDNRERFGDSLGSDQIARREGGGEGRAGGGAWDGERVARVVEDQQKRQNEMEKGSRREERQQPCGFGCGASLMSNNVMDHSEVCSLAPVACLLRMDGCDWTGTRLQRRRHHQRCPMWRIKCSVCCQAVHASDFSEHVASHSASSEAPALRPPGCALRAYGCRACHTSLTPTASSDATNFSEAVVCQALGRGREGERDDGPTGVVADAAGTPAPKGLGQGCEVDGEGTRIKSRRGGKTAHLPHDTLESCPWYRLVCPSCEREMGRDEWDDGAHACTTYRKINVLAMHASGAGMLRNRQWLQLVYGYIGGGGKKNMADGVDDPRDGAFHGVNPMCAMPSVLSSALPVPGPASASTSPATPPP